MDDQFACAGNPSWTAQPRLRRQRRSLLLEQLVQISGGSGVVRLDPVVNVFAVLSRFRRPINGPHLEASSCCRVVALRAAKFASTSAAGTTLPALPTSHPISTSRQIGRASGREKVCRQD